MSKLPSEREMGGSWRNKTALANSKLRYELKKVDHDMKVLEWEDEHKRPWASAGAEGCTLSNCPHSHCSCRVGPACHCPHTLQCSPTLEMKVMVDVRGTSCARGRALQRSTSPCGERVFSRSLSPCATGPSHSRSRSWTASCRSASPHAAIQHSVSRLQVLRSFNTTPA